VAEFSAYRYRVFLAVCPQDRAWGRWLRGALERFRIDRDLVRRQTAAGPVPKSLRPIFWDCVDADATDGTTLAADIAGLAARIPLGLAGISALATRPSPHKSGERGEHPARSAANPNRSKNSKGGIAASNWRSRELSERTLAALQASQFLVVLCSPAAAQSPRLDELIRRFNAMHRDAQVIPVIVGGDPGHHLHDCFPTSLRYKLSAEREPTDECGTPIADTRAEGDGRQVALERVVARLLALDYEEAEPRFTRSRERARNIRHATIAAVLALLAVYEGGLTFAKQELVRNEALLDGTAETLGVIADNTVSTVRRLGLPNVFAADVLTTAEETARELISLGGETARLRYRKAALLISFARHNAALSQPDGHGPRTRAAEAEALLRSLLVEIPGNPAWQRDLAESYDALGDVLAAQGRRRDALAAYRMSAAIAERVTTEPPGTTPRSETTNRHLDLAARHVKAGDAAVQQGLVDDALESYQASLAVDQRLATADRNDPRWQHGLLIAHEKIGDVFRVQGELEQALASYRAGQAVAETLLAAEPGSLAWKRAFSVSQIKIGDVLALTGKPFEAMASYRVSNGIAERVTSADPGNATWQNHLAITHDRIGSVLHAHGDLVAALRQYRVSIDIASRAAAVDPANSVWQRDLGIAHEHAGEALLALGHAKEALAEFEAKRAIVARLAHVEPQNPGWTYDLGNSHARIGYVLEARGRFTEALQEYEACLKIGRSFVAADPGNAQWQRDLAVSYQRLAEARLRQGKTTQALAEMRRGRDIVAALIETAFRASLDVSPDLKQWTDDLARFDARISTLTGRAAPKTIIPGATAEATPTCEACPPGTTTASVLVASDLRSRMDALPAGTPKLDN
jgi:tetratricopeptide (TPR) repeat protein